MRISGFSSLFSAIAVFSAHLPESAKNIAIAEKREENQEILTNLVMKRLTRIAAIATLLSKLKTTPTPNKNGSYGIKVGARMA